MKKLWTVVIILFLFPFAALAKMPTAELTEGRDYLALQTNNPSLSAVSQPGKVVIVEFFSYGCPACFKVEPYLDKWLAHKPNNVVFERIPVVFEPDWQTYAKTYIAGAQLRMADKVTDGVFTAVHSERIDLTNPQIMAQFLSQKGVNPKQFLAAYNSPSTAITMAKNQKIANDYHIFQTPTFIINGKYSVDPSLSGPDPQRLFDTIDYLINKKPV